MKRILIVVTTVLLAAGSYVSVRAMAGSKSPSTPESSGSHRAQPEEGSGDALRVHGHWIVTAFDADGEIRESRDFYNDLDPASGAFTLSAMLKGQATPGTWAVWFDETLRTPCGSTTCTILEPEVSSPNQTGRWGTLVVTPTATGLTLEGVVPEIPYDGTFEGVTSRIYTCRSGSEIRSARTDCVGNPLTGITKTDMDPMDVEAGWRVEVTVEISFT
jgi:hypothetical protein